MLSSKSVITTIFSLLTIWYGSHFAISGMESLPDIESLRTGKKLSDYSTLKELHNVLLELQLIDLSIKTKKDPALEKKISAAMTAVSKNAEQIEKQFRTIRAKQLEILKPLEDLTTAIAADLDVDTKELQNIWDALHKGKLTEAQNTITDIESKIKYTLFKITAIQAGQEIIWKLELPPSKESLLAHAKAVLKMKGESTELLTTKNIETKLAEVNTQQTPPQSLYDELSANNYKTLYAAFDDQRYGIFRRIQLARRLLNDLSHSAHSLDTSSHLGDLYNSILESIYSYGVNVAGTSGKLVELKGFLYGADPLTSEQLLQKLKFNKNQSTSFGAAADL